MEIRTAKDDELKKLYDFEKVNVDNFPDLNDFRQKFEKWPKTFAMAVDDNEIIGNATGKMVG